MAIIDITGKRYGMLTVLEQASEPYIAPNGNRKIKWECVCDCGNRLAVIGSNLRLGKSTNCGCIRKITLPASRRTHGESRGERLYRIYNNMKTRCQNPLSYGFEWYGGKGISVCKEWAESYEAFRAWALANGYQDNLTIDRIDNNGNYEPGNCQWITASENSKKQHADRKRSKGVSSWQG